MAQYRLARPFLLWLFIATTLVYVFTSGSNFSSGDSYSELHVTDSILSHRWFDVPVQAKDVPCAGWGCQGVDGRFYATHAIGNSTFMIPFYGLASAVIRVTGAPHCDDPFWSRCVPIHLISWNTNVLTAATVALIALFGLELGYNLSTAVAAALLYGFASMAWPYARYGFDVTLTGLFVLASVREAVPMSHRQPTAGSWLRAGVWCGLAILVRLPTAIVVLPLAVTCLLQKPRTLSNRIWRFVAFAVPLLVAVSVTAWYNLVRFGSMLDDGHSTNSAERISSTPWEGLFGIVLSPGKGLLWYCPIVILAALAMPAFYRAHRDTFKVSLAVALVSLAPYVVVNDWYGGSAWGPRFIMPVLPLLLLPLLELPVFMSTSFWKKAIVVAVATVSVTLQLAGLLVNYADRLALAARKGYGGDTIWDPKHSPLVDQVGTLITYIANPPAAAHPVPQSQSFDIWWLDLWRIDGVPAAESVLAGGLVGFLAVASIWRAVREARRLSAHSSSPESLFGRHNCCQ